jgi:hypothetical protein
MRNKNVALTGLAVLLPAVLILSGYWYMIRCEGEWSGIAAETRMSDLGDMEKAIRTDVAYMQGLGPRNSENDIAYSRLRQCEAWVLGRWRGQGYEVRRQVFTVKGRPYANLEIEFPGRSAPGKIVIISAQYDTLPGSPGANNNASGMAVLMYLSSMLRHYAPEKTLRLVAFVNEEDPFFGTERMGSYQYAKRSHELHEDIDAMLSLDSLGIYTERPHSQKLPFPFSLFYPDRGNFLAFIGDLGSRSSIEVATRGFKKGSAFPIRAGVVPEWVEGAAWSDHLSFWKFGYPGIQVTDTGAFRSPYHTTKQDTMEKMDFKALARITAGMYYAILELTGDSGE